MAKGGFRGGYGGGGAGGGMNQANMIKQAQKMQEDMLKMQQELEAKTFTATAGGGVVKATVSGKRELAALEIDPEAVDPEDVEMLQDMIIAAVNEALRQVEDASSNSMTKITGMKGLP
ncbi:MAG: YbaB/EbfC family nucleoid-associated protein, partial [Oscillospiraceae bacterium]